ncbi:phage protein [Salinivibrio kushneri]|uniref:Phage tail protein n=1 Tax=Salinivibrio kushneri TaxID=1908198 RepID=A0AB36K8D5_9GAMM|nr:phage protein [Salinivibrio kushneri]OOE45120.1 phage tail protein [Salinivibrio kushneri]
MKISGANFDITLLDQMVHVKKASVTISDDTAVTKTRGVVDGFTHGNATCEVEYELTLGEFRKITAAAKEAGSYRSLPVHDALFYANAGEDDEENEDKVEVFGVKLTLSDVLSVDPESADENIRKLKGFVTSPQFVRINDVPYLSENDTRELVN